MRSKTIFFVLFAVLFISAWTNVLFAQTTAEITGTITDTSGAVVPNARIAVTSEETGSKTEATTNEAGRYDLRFLRPGSYRIEVQKEGFRGLRRDGVRLQVAQGVTLDFRMEVGAVAETVTVTAEATLLDTASNVIGGVVTAERIENLPMNGRNSSAFMFLTPGVRVQRVAMQQPVVESHWQFFSINGSRPNMNQFLLDGGDNNDVGFNGPEYSASVDAIQEFRVQTNNFSAEYGNSAGGVINTITKGGTNEFHGSLYEYFRNDKLQANNFFNNANSQKRPTLRQNQFGGTVGGPIVRNKAFFFASSEELRLRQPSVTTTTVPTDLQKTGDFSQTFTSSGGLITIFDPTSTVRDPSNPAKYIRTQFSNNTIPLSRINPVSANVAKYYPAATSSGSPNTHLNNYFFSGATKQRVNDISVRADYRLNDSTTLMTRVSDAFVNIKNPQVLSTIADYNYTNTDQRHFSSVFSLTRVFSPTMVGEFIFSWNRFYHYRTSLTTNNFNPTTLGFPSYLAAGSKVLGFPQFAAEGMANLGSYVYEPHGYDRPNISVVLSKTSGAHGFKFGGSMNVARLNGIGFHTAAGTYAFAKSLTQGPDPFQGGVGTGSGMATLLLGSPTTATHNPNIGDAAASSKNFGLYFQDDYKVNTKLTLNLGLRWDLESPRTERYNRFTNMDFTSTATLPNGASVRGGFMFPTVNGLDRGQWNSQKKNFQPRIGFAYNVAKATVLRGGLGVFYGNSWGGAMNYNQLANFGFDCSTPMTTSLDGGLTPAASLSNPFPTGFCTPSGNKNGLLTSLGETVSAVNRNHATPKSVTWSFDIQHLLPKNVLFAVTYSGNRGLNLIGFRELDQLDPKYLSNGTKLNDPVTNPYYGVIKAGTLSGPTITLGQSLRPYPQFGGLTSAVETYGASTYHALYVKLERRFANGLSLTGSYTFSKIIDDVVGGVTGFAGGGMARGDLQNYYSNANERSIASFNTPQTLVISYVYELPFGPGKQYLTKAGAVGKFIGGWQINGSALFQSGEPLQITGGNSSGTMAGLQRPNWNGKNPTITGGKITDRLGRYFDTSAFSLNAPFTFGNAPRIMPNLYGPGPKNFDISLFKSTTITERWKLQFRAECYNAFNRVQFGNPTRDITSASFGRITSQVNLPRVFQLALKVLF